MTCKRCGRHETVPGCDYCLPCIDAIIREWEEATNQPIDYEVSFEVSEVRK